MKRPSSIPNDTRRISRFLSLVLRHQPQKIGVNLDEAGWADVGQLLDGMRSAGFSISWEVLADVVATNDKQRFEFNADTTRIRATQGHSVAVDHGYDPEVPPACLYHGTPERSSVAIRTEGLQKMQRHHVHLHPDRKLAESVGARRGRPVVLVVRSGEMSAAGYVFFRTSNNVWLTDSVPPEFIDFPD